MSTSKYLRAYEMNNAQRGQILVINNEKFYGGMSNRPGTEKDAARLEDTFTKLGFQVEIKNNLTKDQMVQAVIQVAESDHSNNDCVAIAILSHGSQDEKMNYKDAVYGTDSLPIRLDELLKPLKMPKFKKGTKEVDSTLVGKPKLVFVQACRGFELDPGANVCDSGFAQADSDSVEADSVKVDPKPVKPLTIPIEADFLTFYSTTSGYFAWRSSKDGAVFIQTLCDVLDANPDGSVDLASLLTCVSGEVAEQYSSRCNKPWMDGMKEMPVVQNQLRKLIYLTPKK